MVLALQADVTELRRVYAAHYSNKAVFNLCEWVEEKWRKYGGCRLYLYKSADFR
jgi:hypothetical protein